MRDKIMNNQLQVLDGNQLNTPVSYDGLRKVDNLPKDIHKTNDDLYLPPIFADRKGNNVNRPGVQITTEFNQKLPQLGSNKGIALPFRPSINSISYENYKTRNQNNNSSLERLRSNYGIRSDKERSLGAASYNRPNLGANKYSYSSLKAGGLARPQYPSSAYVPSRQPGLTRYYSGTLTKGRYGRAANAPLANSPYVAGTLVQPESQNGGPSPPRYTPMTKEDFTMEALQQKKQALERLNERLKNL